MASFRAALMAGDLISGPNADVDGGGMANLLEFVCGTDPWVPEWTAAADGGVVASRRRPAIEPGPAAGDWQAVHAKRKSADPTGLTAIPRICSNLGDWGEAGGAPVVLADDGEVEKVALPFSSHGDGSPCFFRLSASLAP